MHLQQNDHKVWLYFGLTIKFGYKTRHQGDKIADAPLLVENHLHWFCQFRFQNSSRF